MRIGEVRRRLCERRAAADGAQRAAAHGDAAVPPAAMLLCRPAGGAYPLPLLLASFLIRGCQSRQVWNPGSLSAPLRSGAEPEREEAVAALRPCAGARPAESSRALRRMRFSSGTLWGGNPSLEQHRPPPANTRVSCCSCRIPRRERCTCAGSSQLTKVVLPTKARYVAQQNVLCASGQWGFIAKIYYSVAFNFIIVTVTRDQFTKSYLCYILRK